MVYTVLQIIFGLLISIVVVTADDQINLVADSSKLCESALIDWVRNIHPKFDPSDQTLHVHLTTLYQTLKIGHCYKNSSLWLELWRVTDTPTREDGFGTHDYFSKFQRCQDLNPELFEYHGSRQLATFIDGTVYNVIDWTMFTHIVERKYVFRVCPCGRPRKSTSGVQYCDCKYSDTAKPHCGAVFTLEQGPDARVFPWCRRRDPAPTPEMTVLSPVVNCTSVLLNGKLASCTPMQDYDRVKVTLHLVNNSDIIKNCSAQKHFGNENPVVVEMGIVNPNDSFGEYSFYLVDLLPDSYYCMQIELVDHPYCNSHFVINDHFSSPRVCSSRVLHPIKTPPCSVNRGQLIRRNTNSNKSDYVLVIAASAMACIVCTICCIVICIVRFFRTRTSHAVKGGVHSLKTGKPVPSFSHYDIENGQVVCAAPGSGKDDGKVINDVFLLQLNYSLPGDQHAMLQDWLKALGCRTHDLNNPDDEEGINADPEGWVQDMLTDPDTKVLVVEPCDVMKETERKLGTPSTSGNSSLNGSSASFGDPRVLKSHDDFETDPLLDDPRYELKSYAWKFIQSHFVGKYNKVLFVRFFEDVSLQQNHISSDVTPHRQSFLIPHHLSEIRRWLIHGSKSSTRFSNSKEKAIEQCEQRLFTALKVPSSDCI